MIEPIVAWLNAATRDDVAVIAALIDPADIAALTHDELRDVSQARPQRRAEFASGRAALHTITGDSTSIRIGGDGRPLMPYGWIGSVAHDDLVIVAIAARANHTNHADRPTRSVGVDIEGAGRLDTLDATAVIAADDHVPWDDPVAALVAKEAAFKAWAAAQPDDLRRSHPERWPNTWLELTLARSTDADVGVRVICDHAAGSIAVLVARIDARWVAVADRDW